MKRASNTPIIELISLSLICAYLMFLTADHWLGAIRLRDIYIPVSLFATLMLIFITTVLLYRLGCVTKLLSLLGFVALMGCGMTLILAILGPTLDSPNNMVVKVVPQKAFPLITIALFLSVVAIIYYWFYPQNQSPRFIRALLLTALILTPPLSFVLGTRSDQRSDLNQSISSNGMQFTLRVALDNRSDYGVSLSDIENVHPKDHIVLYKCNRLWIKCLPIYETRDYDVGGWISGLFTPIETKPTLQPTEDGIVLTINNEVIFSSP